MCLFNWLLVVAVTVGDILALVCEIAPASLAEAWDNVGLLLGDPAIEVSGIMVSLDPTSRVLEEALAADCNLIISHHPLIFHPLKSLRRDQGLGKLYFAAVEARVSMIAAHTNLDRVVGGVNDALAAALGLGRLRPLAPDTSDPETGMGRIGDLVVPVSGADFVARLGEVCKCSTLAVAGDLPGQINRVGLCGGSGAELAVIARSRGADVFVSAEIKHSVGRWAEEEGFCLVDAGHFNTENPVVEVLASRLVAGIREMPDRVPVHVSRGQESPFRFIITN